MNRVTIRVPATTANLGPGFDAFGCALGLYTDVTFEETDGGLEITGCPEEFTGPDNLVYVSYCAVLSTLNVRVRGRCRMLSGIPGPGRWKDTAAARHHCGTPPPAPGRSEHGCPAHPVH